MTTLWGSQMSRSVTSPRRRPTKLLFIHPSPTPSHPNSPSPSPLPTKTFSPLSSPHPPLLSSSNSFRIYYPIHRIQPLVINHKKHLIAYAYAYMHILQQITCSLIISQRWVGILFQTLQLSPSVRQGARCLLVD